MKRLFTAISVLALGLAIGGPAAHASTDAGVAGPAQAGLATSGEPTPGADVTVRYWGANQMGSALIFVGVGIPGATVRLSEPGFEDATTTVGTDGTWVASFVNASDDSDPTSPVTITQSVGGSVHDTTSIAFTPAEVNSHGPSGFTVNDAECFVDPYYVVYAGTGKPLWTVQVHGNTAADTPNNPEFAPLGQFTVPVDGTWKITTSAKASAPPLLLDFYQDGVWKGGTLVSGPGDCSGAGYTSNAKGTDVVMGPIATMAAAASESPAAAHSAAPTATASASAHAAKASQKGGVGPGVWLAIAVVLLVVGGTGRLMGKRRHEAE